MTNPCPGLRIRASCLALARCKAERGGWLAACLLVAAAAPIARSPSTSAGGHPPSKAKEGHWPPSSKKCRQHASQPRRPPRTSSTIKSADARSSDGRGRTPPRSAHDGTSRLPPRRLLAPHARSGAFLHKGRAPHQRRRPRADNPIQRWGEYSGRLRRHVRRRKPNGRRAYQAGAGGGEPPPSILGSTNATSANRRQRDHKSLSSSRATDHRTRARSLLRAISSGRPRTEQRALYRTAASRTSPAERVRTRQVFCMQASFSSASLRVRVRSPRPSPEPDKPLGLVRRLPTRASIACASQRDAERMPRQPCRLTHVMPSLAGCSDTGITCPCRHHMPP